MHQNDFDRFSKLIGRLAAVYGKKLDDELIQGYWVALKDLSLERITELAEYRIKHGKFFPKPVELRPPEDKSPPDSTGRLEAIEKRSMQNLEELRQKDPGEWISHMTKLRPGCRALQYAREYGVSNIWYDVEQRCWRRSA